MKLLFLGENLPPQSPNLHRRIALVHPQTLLDRLLCKAIHSPIGAGKCDLIYFSYTCEGLGTLNTLASSLILESALDPGIYLPVRHALAEGIYDVMKRYGDVRKIGKLVKARSHSC